MIEQYEHHGIMVSVFSERKGKHKDHCLCFVCSKFKPGTKEHCPIAQATFENCVKYGTTTPMYECPEFKEKLTAYNKQSTPCCSKCGSERVTVTCNECGFVHCM